MNYPPARSLAVLLLLSLAAPHAAADTYPRQPGVDALHYVFRVTLRDDSDEIAGEAVAEMKFVQDGVTECALDLASAANGKGMTVLAVTVGDAPVKYVHDNSRLRITLDPPSKAGEARKFGAWLGEVTGLPVVFWDERFTTVEAESALWQAGLTHRQRKARRDRVAAQILLQAYLDAGCPPEPAAGPLEG